MIKKILIILWAFIIFSCEKEEIPFVVEGCTDQFASNFNQYATISNNDDCEYGSVIRQISLESDYRNQIFYALDDTIISNNLKEDWDLSFENGSEGYHIRINSATFSQIATRNNVLFENITTILDLKWSWDSPSGNLDSTAIGNHQDSLGTVWILDRGLDFSGLHRGYKKFVIDTVTATYYMIKYANIDNTEEINIKVNKNNEYHFTQFSFSTNSTTIIEPKKDQWDLLFTQYTHLFLDNIDVPAYLVTGVLINSMSGTTVAIDTENEFDSINSNMISTYYFSSNQDIIGYNWKYYNFDTETYQVSSNINYIIKGQQDHYFKLRFINFYNSFGEKGHPTFEMQKL